MFYQLELKEVVCRLYDCHSGRKAFSQKMLFYILPGNDSLLPSASRTSPQCNIARTEQQKL